MKSSEYRKEIDALLKRNPKAEKIASIQAVEKFKEVVAKAKKPLRLKSCKTHITN